uniref:Laminin IV type A domain-containing protein n=1 Tax=Cryptomonas curvata TaxID=233186 RepID=A0A7S0MBC6_9CRYP|mmetsp:Transcript_33324/g.69797  ORF Transcript_33324/g.69797 Transcript_33324/m.69797 type:complete len:1677 (+) Transcript_33324:101-5131(+)
MIQNCWWIIIFGVLIVCERDGSKPKLVVEYLFIRDTNGWSIESEDQKYMHSIQLEVSTLSLEASDQRNQKWYFTSPSNLAGDRLDMYNGILSFKLNHVSRPNPSNAHRMPSMADVLLESECGHFLQLFDLVDSGRVVPRSYHVHLNENGGWIDSRSRGQPSQQDFVGVLANLRSIKIRGSFYSAAETVRLASVQVQEAKPGTLNGRTLYPCCSSTSQGEVDICVSKNQLRTGKPRFDCHGSRRYRVQIFNIFPRFGRKSGGSTITVKGENFGLTGSQSALRIAGKKSRACRYPFTEFVPNNAPTNADLLAAHCTNQVLDVDEDKIDCGGIDCPKCIANALPHHCSNGVLDFDETAVGTVATKLGLQDCGGKCLSAASCCNGKQDNDETGADCGGTHCQPCDPQSIPVGTAFANGLNVIASGTCSKNGCRCFANSSNGVRLCLDSQALIFSQTTGIMNFSGQSGLNTGNLSALLSSKNSSSVPEAKISCPNVLYLSSLDSTSDLSYINKTIILTGGPGQGQVAIVAEYDHVSKMATMKSDWKMSPNSVPTDNVGKVWWKIGTIQVLKGGQGYSNGVWRLSRNQFANAFAVGDEGWGTFSVNDHGAVVDAQIWNVGFYGNITGTGGGDVDNIDSNNFFFNTQQNGNQKENAVLKVNWYTKRIMAPSTYTSYILIDEDSLNKPNLLHRLPQEPQHNTLVCETPAGDGKDIEFMVESCDETNSAVTSCPSLGARGFEYGAMDFIWSLHAAVRQPLGIKSLTVAAMDIDRNTGDIYWIANVFGSCQETIQGCIGLISSLFPNRGLFASGGFQPLVVSPVGSMASIVVRLSRDGLPIWLTQIDSSDVLGQVQASSLFIDSKISPTRICISGLYITEYNIRFWHVNPKTNLPYSLSRVDALDGRGRCNRALCVGNVCSMHVPVVDNIQCIINPQGLRNVSCVPLCAYLEEYPSTLPSQQDAFLVEMTSSGQFSWSKSRISTQHEGSVLSNVLIAAGGSDVPGEFLDLPSYHDLYLSFTVTIQNSSSPPFVSLGTSSFVETEPFEVSMPSSSQLNSWAFLVKLKGSEVIWARRLGPLGKEGILSALKVKGQHAVVAGHYAPSSFSAAGFDVQSCQYQANCGLLAQKYNLNSLNSVCAPSDSVYALYKASSWEYSKKGQWDDLSGNGRHGNATRGTPWITSAHNALDSISAEPKEYIQGGEHDGIQFPPGTLPSSFTLCTLSKMTVAGKGSVIDAVGNDKWFHGHMDGFAGVSYYGNGTYVSAVTSNLIPVTEWISMCGQNKQGDSVFNVNGRFVHNFAGGAGNKRLSINDGFGRSLGMKSSWAVAEVIIWDRFLTATEINSVISHLSSQNRETFKFKRSNPVVGIRNLFVVSFDNHGQVAWLREAKGGNLTVRAMDVAVQDGMIKATQNISNSELSEDPLGYVYIAGQVTGQVVADFGVTLFPEWCSKDLSVGTLLSVSGDLLNRSNTTCSGQIVARGHSTDIFLVKYALRSGEQQWLKRLGQKDTMEEALGLAVNPISGEAFIAGSFSKGGDVTPLGYHDTFDLKAAGRANSIGCPVNLITNIDNQGLRQQMNPSIGAPNCTFTSHTNVPNLKAGYVISVSILNTNHGNSSRPWSQCSKSQETGCNADGLLWAKSIGSGVMETRSTTAESMSTGIVITRCISDSHNLLICYFCTFILLLYLCH